MKNKSMLTILALTIFAVLHRAAAQDTAFTYQGRLMDNGSPGQWRRDRENAKLKQKNDSLEKRLDALEKIMRDQKTD